MRLAVADQYQTFTFFSNKVLSQAQQAQESLAVVWAVHTDGLVPYCGIGQGPVRLQFHHCSW